MWSFRDRCLIGDVKLEVWSGMSRGNGIATFCGFVQSIDEESHVLVVCSVVGILVEESSDTILLKLLLVD